MKLSKEKRDQLLLAGISTVVLLVGIWYLWIGPRYAAIKITNKNIGTRNSTLSDMQDTITKATAAADQLHEATNALAETEKDLAFGDPNAWIYDTIRHFKAGYKVDISLSSQASIDDVDILPSFPYKQLRFGVNGTAFYHDFGHFVANFENEFPHARIVNLRIDPPGDPASEKLSFHMDIIALVKQTEPQS